MRQVDRALGFFNYVVTRHSLLDDAVCRINFEYLIHGPGFRVLRPSAFIPDGYKGEVSLRWVKKRLDSRHNPIPAGRVIEPPCVQPTPPAQSKPDLVDIFTPARPKIAVRSLTGRRSELSRIVAALIEERRHVVLYSERGRGKTSLANSAVGVLRSRGAAVARFTCHSGSSFEEIVRGLLRDLPGSLLVVPTGQRHGSGCEAALPEGRFELGDLVQLPARMTCQTLVWVVDEFDRVESALVRSQIADAVKQLSDRGSRLVFMLIGVSENLHQLLGQHQSIRRNLVPIALPLLSRNEISMMVESGAREAGFEVSSALSAAVSTISHGMPYIAQSVALRLTQATAARAGTVTSETDLRNAAGRLIEEADPGVAARYADLTAYGSDRVMVRALNIIATADQARDGQLATVRSEQGVRLGQSHIPAECWQRAIEAGVISLHGAGDANIVTPSDRDLLTYVLLLTIAEQSLTFEDPLGPAARLQSSSNVSVLTRSASQG